MTDKDYLTVALNNKLKENYTNKYKEMLQFIFNKLIEELNEILCRTYSYRKNIEQI